MNATVSKTISYVFLTLAVLWFSIFFLLELAYVVGVFKKEPGIFYALNRISDDQLSPLNVVLTLILLLPGLGAYKLFERFNPNKGGNIKS